MCPIRCEVDGICVGETEPSKKLLLVAEHPKTAVYYDGDRTGRGMVGQNNKGIIDSFVLENIGEMFFLSIDQFVPSTQPLFTDTLEIISVGLKITRT